MRLLPLFLLIAVHGVRGQTPTNAGSASNVPPGNAAEAAAKKDKRKPANARRKRDDNYDYVILLNPPTPGHVVTASLICADYISHADCLKRVYEETTLQIQSK